MENVIILIIIFISIGILKILLKCKKNEIKEIANNEYLNKIVEKLPNNKEICKYILRKLNNENVTLQEEENTNCFYFVATNKILLNKKNKSFVRIQTIAHECIHSVQPKKLLWFNYIFSNLLNIFFIIISILSIFKIITNSMILIITALIFIIIFYVVRSYLEIDAMIKAEYLAKEYLIEKEVKEVNLIIKEYKHLNSIGIRYVCYNLVASKLNWLNTYIFINIILNFIR